jgi:hypothetical protein
MDNEKYITSLLKFLIIAFLAALLFLIFRSWSFSEEFTDLASEHSLNDTISAVYDEGRGAGRVTLKSKKKFHSLEQATKTMAISLS